MVMCACVCYLHCINMGAVNADDDGDYVTVACWCEWWTHNTPVDVVVVSCWVQCQRRRCVWQRSMMSCIPHSDLTLRNLISTGWTSSLSSLLKAKRLAFVFFLCVVLVYLPSLPTLLVGHQEEYPPCKSGAGVVICLEWGAVICIWSSWYHCQCHPISSWFIKIHIRLTFLMSTFPGCPGKEAIKRVSLSLRVVVVYCILVVDSRVGE